MTFVDQRSSFLLTSHQDPDGDSIGSLIGLGNLLLERGKMISIYCQGTPPDKYQFLDPEKIIKYEYPSEKLTYDNVIVLDCPRLDRIGFVKSLISENAVIANIDHHTENEMFGDINIVDTGASAVGEMLCVIFTDNSHKFRKNSAVPFYAAILSDTGGFRFPNTTSGSFSCAARLVADGADPKSIYDNIYSSFSVETMKLLGKGLLNLILSEDNRICAMIISQDDIAKTGASMENTEGFVDYTMKVKNSSVGVLFKEIGHSTIKVSLRSRGEFDVCEFALKRGGGGHRLAAGFTAMAPLNSVIRQTMSDLKRELDG